MLFSFSLLLFCVSFPGVSSSIIYSLMMLPFVFASSVSFVSGLPASFHQFFFSLCFYPLCFLCHFPFNVFCYCLIYLFSSVSINAFLLPSVSVLFAFYYCLPCLYLPYLLLFLCFMPPVISSPLLYPFTSFLQTRIHTIAPSKFLPVFLCFSTMLQISPRIMMATVEMYKQDLEVFAHMQLPRFHMASSFHERADSSLLLLVRQSPYIHTLVRSECEIIRKWCIRLFDSCNIASELLILTGYMGRRKCMYKYWEKMQ